MSVQSKISLPLVRLAKRHHYGFLTHFFGIKAEDQYGQESGYTIIEVTLFLAVSGLLLAMALIGTGTTLQATRFTDSSRSLTAYVQQQYDNVLNGVNTRSGTESCAANIVDPNPPIGQPSGTTSCILLGRLMTFTQGSATVQSYNIIGTEPAQPNYNESDEQLIEDFQPTIVTSVGVDTFVIPWNATISGSKRLGDGKAVDAVALIRSPRSDRILTYVYEQPTGTYSLASLVDPTQSADTKNFNSPTNMSNLCLKSSDAFSVQSKLTLTGGQGQDAMQLAFDAVTTDCNGQ